MGEWGGGERGAEERSKNKHKLHQHGAQSVICNKFGINIFLTFAEKVILCFIRLIGSNGSPLFFTIDIVREKIKTYNRHLTLVYGVAS